MFLFLFLVPVFLYAVTMLIFQSKTNENYRAVIADRV